MSGTLTRHLVCRADKIGTKSGALTDLLGAMSGTLTRHLVGTMTGTLTHRILVLRLPLGKPLLRLFVQPLVGGGDLAQEAKQVLQGEEVLVADRLQQLAQARSRVQRILPENRQQLRQ